MMECLGSECGEIRGQHVEYYEKKKEKKKTCSTTPALGTFV